MSYLSCPDCGKEIPVFGKSRVDEIAKTHNIPYVAKLPVNPALADVCDQGKMEEFEGNWLQEIWNGIV